PIEQPPFFFPGSRRHTSSKRDWSSDVCSSDLAYKLLTPLLGVGGASAVFAIALLASGQNYTLTGTLAGQIVMEGFLNIRLRPWEIGRASCRERVWMTVDVVGYIKSCENRERRS